MIGLIQKLETLAKTCSSLTITHQGDLWDVDLIYGPGSYEACGSTLEGALDSILETIYLDEHSRINDDPDANDFLAGHLH